jgi:hypothetical protein
VHIKVGKDWQMIHQTTQLVHTSNVNTHLRSFNGFVGLVAMMDDDDDDDVYIFVDEHDVVSA